MSKFNFYLLIFSITSALLLIFPLCNHFLETNLPSLAILIIWVILLIGAILTLGLVYYQARTEYYFLPKGYRRQRYYDEIDYACQQLQLFIQLLKNTPIFK